MLIFYSFPDTHTQIDTITTHLGLTTLLRALSCFLFPDVQNGHRKLNQFGDYEDVTNMTVDDWSYRWSMDQTKFHMPKVHPYVVYFLFLELFDVRNIIHTF